MAEAENNTIQTSGKGGGNQKGIFLAIALIIIVVLIGVIVILMGRQEKTEETTTAEETTAARRREVLVDEENVDRILDETPPDSGLEAAERYTVTMNSLWQFEDGGSESSNAYVENSTDNAFPVYFDITIKDTEQVIYESPILPVGMHIEGIKLDEDLDAGVYDCIITYHLVNEDQETLSTVNVALTIIVKN